MIPVELRDEIAAMIAANVLFGDRKVIFPHDFYEVCDQILAIPRIAQALEYYRIMHSQGHDVEQFYKEGIA